MRRSIAGLLIVLFVLGVTGSAIASSSDGPDSQAKAAKAKRCGAKTKRARVGGKTVCLRVGLKCSATNKRVYKRYGFVCVRRKLAKIKKPVQTAPTAPTNT